MHELLPLPNTSELQNTLVKGTRRHPLELVGKQWFSAKMPPKPPETKKSTRNPRAISRKVAQENQFSAQENQFSAQSRAILEFLEFLNNFQWFLLVADPASQKTTKKWFSNQCLGSVLFYTTHTYTANSWKTKNLSFKTYLCCRKTKALCWKTKNIIVFLDNSKSLAQPSGVLGISRTRLFRGLWPDPSKLENLVGTLLWLAPKALRSLRGSGE